MSGVPQCTGGREDRLTLRGWRAAACTTRRNPVSTARIRVEKPDRAFRPESSCNFLQFIFMAKVLICSLKDPWRSITKLR